MRLKRYTAAPGDSPQAQRLFRRHRPFRTLEPDAARRPSARAHVLGKRGQLGEVLFDAGVDEIARAGAAHQQTFLDQAVDRLAHRDARDVQFGRQLALGRQGLGRAVDAAVDRFAQGALQLLVERQVAGGGKVLHQLRERGHAVRKVSGR
jgi:hypothetical protein